MPDYRQDNLRIGDFNGLGLLPFDYSTPELMWDFDASYEGESEGGSNWDTSATCPHCGSHSFITADGKYMYSSVLECMDCEHRSQE